MRVVNKYKEKYTHYIGRGSIFGNPFVMGKDGNRKEVIMKYRHYLIDKKNVLRAIYNLPKDAVLGCFCKPKACHGDIIMQLYNNFRGIK